MNRFIKRYGQIIFGITFIFYFLYTISNALDINKNVTIAVSLTIILYIQSVSEFFYYYKKIGRPRLIDWMKVTLFILLVLNFMELVNNANGSTLVKIVNTTTSLNDAPYTMVIILFSFFSLDMGTVFSKKIKPKIKNLHYSIKRKNWVFGILLFSTLIQTYLLFSGLKGFGVEVKDSSGIISLVNSIENILNPFVLIISAYIIFLENSKIKTYITIFYGSLLVQVLLGFLSGMKENTLIPIFYVGVVYLIAGKKIPKNVIYIGLFIFVLLYPINNSYRNVIDDPYVNTGSSTLNMAIAIKQVFTKPLSETLLGGVESYADRGGMYPFLQYSITIEPEWNYYKYMTRYLGLPFAWFVPRALWRDKPTADIGGALYEKIVGVRTATAVTPLNVGWGYLEGGPIFLIAIFVLLGIIVSSIEKMNLSTPLGLLFYVLILHKVVKPEWDPYFFLVSLIQMFFMYWILLKVIGLKKKELIL